MQKNAMYQMLHGRVCAPYAIHEANTRECPGLSECLVVIYESEITPTS